MSEVGDNLFDLVVEGKVTFEQLDILYMGSLVDRMQKSDDPKPAVPEKVKAFLDGLRASSEINMYAAGPKLRGYADRQELVIEPEKVDLMLARWLIDGGEEGRSKDTANEIAS